jgi:hypothetical protein
VKQAIQKAREFATDVLGQSDLLLEEVSSDDGKFRVTLSMPRRAGSSMGAPENISAMPNPLYEALTRLRSQQYYAADREFKEFEVNKSDGSVMSMSIREVA